jgi:multidrug efflux pump subunit AcrB
MSRFNLTEISLKNKSLVYYFILVIFFTGIYSYVKLGRMEDPDFTMRQMVVSVAWPGATAREVEEQVTDKLEKKLQDLPNLDYIKSYSKEGQAVIYVNLDDAVKKSEIRSAWYEARNLANDIKSDLPTGVVGPFFNDRFDDVYGSIYALTSDGFTYEEMRDRAEKIRRTLLNLPSVKKVELIGVQEEKIYVEIEANKLAKLGISPTVLSETIKNHNAMNPSGMIDTATDNVYIRLSGELTSLDSLKNLQIPSAGKMISLGDIATISRKYSEPAEPKMYFDGQEAIGIAVSMESGGNVLELGENLQKTIAEIKTNLPAGLELSQVSNQPEVVADSINDFVRMLFEAIAIVLAVSFLSLGMRTGMVVACCIPLVIAAVFMMMNILSIDLHRVSLGALIISLGLLVDDAIIAVEMMAVKLEEGYDRFDAACHAYNVTARPMLTGTLITCAGFLPIPFAKGVAAEFTSALFPVISISLLISWLVSVMAAPLFGYKLIQIKPSPKGSAYDKKFYRIFKNVLILALRHRKAVLALTGAAFIFSLCLMPFIKQEFFPPSTRNELIVEMNLAQGSSLKATESEAMRLAEKLKKDDRIDSFSVYVGEGAPRFILTLEPVLPSDSYAQIVIVAKDIKSRTALQSDLSEELKENFPSVRANLKVPQLGPPAAYPVMLRVSGYDHDKVKKIAANVAQEITDEHLQNVHLDWNEKSKTVHLNLDEAKMRALGIDRTTLSQLLYTELSGATVGEYYEGDKTVDIVLRLTDARRIGSLKNLPVPTASGEYVALAQVADLSYDAEDGIIWRRDLKPTVTVQAALKDDSLTANNATQTAYDKTRAIREKLPQGYSIEVGGSLENSNKAIKYLAEPLPLMILAIITLLMLQLKKMPLMLLTLLTAPLGLIGVSLGMLLGGEPMGFVAQLGILALSGMIIRNSVILIDQIESHKQAGETPWNAIIDSAVLRFRPIMLTAAAAILGMIPLMRSSFWGPMAVAIASGLFAATVLTLLVLPVMYAAWYKVEE